MSDWADGLDVGSNTQTFDDGTYIVYDSNGDIAFTGAQADYSGVGSNSVADKIAYYAKTYGTDALKALTNAFKDSKGNTDWSRVAGAVGGLYGLYQASQNDSSNKGYQGGIPTYTSNRTQLDYTSDPNRRPGSAGRRYFSDTTFTKTSGTPAVTTAGASTAPVTASTATTATTPTTAANTTAANTTAANTTAANTTAANTQSPTNLLSSYTAKDPILAALVDSTKAGAPTTQPQALAAGGIAGLAKGRYLRGHTDGMADKIPSTIGDNEPAALSHGEFVIPADVVSHLGNGNSDAGANRLYEMMDRIRKARTGTTKQGRQIDPHKFMPS